MKHLVMLLALSAATSAAADTTLRCIDPINENTDGWAYILNFDEEGQIVSQTGYSADFGGITKQKCEKKSTDETICITYDQDGSSKDEIRISPMSEFDNYEDEYPLFVLDKIRETGAEPTHYLESIMSGKLGIRDDPYLFARNVFVICEEGEYKVEAEWIPAE